MEEKEAGLRIQDRDQNLDPSQDLIAIHLIKNKGHYQNPDQDHILIHLKEMETKAEMKMMIRYELFNNSLFVLTLNILVKC